MSTIQITPASIHRRVSSTKRPDGQKFFIYLPLLLLYFALVVSALSAAELLKLSIFRRGGSVFRYWNLFILIIAAGLRAVTLKTRSFARAISRTLRVNWPLTILFIWSLMGTIYGRFVLKHPTSFFSGSFMMLTFLLAYFIFFSLPNGLLTKIYVLTTRVFVIVGIIGGFTVLVNIILNGLARASANIGLLLNQGLVFFWYFGVGFARIVIPLVFILLSVFSFKNTVILVTFCVLFMFILLPRKKAKKLSLMTIAGIIASVILIVLVIVGRFALIDYFSDGNSSFRRTLYLHQIQRFAKSPLWGELFSGETGIELQWGAGVRVVPSHGDWADILAQGGIIGILLFLGIFIRIVYQLLQIRLRLIEHNPSKAKLATWALLFIGSGLITSSFNPILNTPDISFVLWVGIAFSHIVVDLSVKDIHSGSL